MSDAYKISECTDFDLVREICFSKDLLHRLSDDFFDPDNYKPDGLWLRCDRNSVCVGLVKVNIRSPLDLRVHIAIPKSNRNSCLKIGKAFVSFLEARKGGYVKLSTKVGEQYGNVVKFAERIGFTVDGLDKMSYQRDGQIYDRVIMSYIFKRQS